MSVLTFSIQHYTGNSSQSTWREKERKGLQLVLYLIVKNGMFPPVTGNKSRMTVLLFNKVLEVLTSAKTQEKEIKVTQIKNNKIVTICR